MIEKELIEKGSDFNTVIARGSNLQATQGTFLYITLII